MPFNSYGFIFIVLPITLAGFYILKRSSGEKGGSLIKAFLILMSAVFFVQFGWYNFFVLMGSIAVDLGFVYLMRKYAPKEAKTNDFSSKDAMEKAVGAINSAMNAAAPEAAKPNDFAPRAAAPEKTGPNSSAYDRIFRAAIIVNIAGLALFKYSTIVFPLAVSFYTFSQISFLCDYKRAVSKADDSFKFSVVDYLLYILYFPKLLQGPIAKYRDLSVQFDEMASKSIDCELFIRGFMLFAIGLAKKVLIADVLGKGTAYGFANIGTLTSIDAILVVTAYALQLYFDFSSYCDLGEGVSMMLGIVLPVNFNSPYRSDNFGEFWHRWHITLTRFLTDYIYIPLGGSREGEAKTYRNLFIVLVLSGLWHGNTFVFLIWGILNGIYTSLSRLILKGKKLKGVFHAAGVVITFCLWSLQSIFFNVKTIGEAWLMLTRFFSTKLNFLFATRDLLAEMVPVEFSYIFAATPLSGTPWEVVVPCWLMIFICLFIVFFMKNSHEIAVTGRLTFVKTILTAGLFVYSIMSLGNVSTFIYTNF